MTRTALQGLTCGDIKAETRMRVLGGEASMAREGVRSIRNLSPELLNLFALCPVDRYAMLREKLLASLHDVYFGGHVSNGVARQTLTNGFSACQLPVQPLSFERYVDKIIAEVVPHCVNLGSPRCLGHMTGAIPPFLLPLGDLILALNQNLVKEEASGSFTFVERQTLALMHRLVYDRDATFYAEHTQNPTATLGIMSSGSTVANITALWIARNRAFAVPRKLADVEQSGLAAALESCSLPGAVIIGSRLMHYSIEKAAGLLGIGAGNVIKMPVDENNRLRANALRKVISQVEMGGKKILAVVGTAGTTDCGSIDPIADIAAVARECGIHFHVDAAWGTALLFSDQHREKLAGIEDADSVTLDGHKQLHLPAGASLLVLRDPSAADVIEKEATYMLLGDSGDLGKRSLEGSRAASAVFLHAALNVIGLKGYESLINFCLDCALTMAERIRNRTEFELLAEPETNIVLYRYLPPPWQSPGRPGSLPETAVAQINICNERLQNAQYEAGRTYVSKTIIPSSRHNRPTVALRAVITNPLTTRADLEAVLADQAQIGDELWTRELAREQQCVFNVAF
jgi:putative pyridoxal-dependent aspartate 1-decarboxylase